jgi:hypothetical protein
LNTLKAPPPLTACADRWSLFDTGVVVSSIALLGLQSTGSGGGGNAWVKQLRVLRAFRLFRLLGKMGDLKKIVTAVAMSIVPTLQALVRLGWPDHHGRRTPGPPHLPTLNDRRRESRARVPIPPPFRSIRTDNDASPHPPRSPLLLRRSPAAYTGDIRQHAGL